MKDLTDDRIVLHPGDSGSLLRVPLGRVHEVRAILYRAGAGHSVESPVAFGAVVFALASDADAQKVQEALDGVD